MSTRATLAEDFWDRPLRDLFQTLEATPSGLTSDEANRRLRLYGPNSFVKESRFAALFSFLRLVANPLVIILLIASGASLALGDRIGGLIIIPKCRMPRANSVSGGCVARRFAISPKAVSLPVQTMTAVPIPV